MDLVKTFHSGDANDTSTENSNGHSSVRARQMPATVIAAKTGQIQFAALASNNVVTGKAALILVLKYLQLLIYLLNI